MPWACSSQMVGKMKAELNAETPRRQDAKDSEGFASWRPGDLALSEGFRDTPLGPLPETWEVVQFEDAIRRQPACVGKVKQQDYKPKGCFPIIDQGQNLVAGYWDDPLDSYQGELPVIVFGDHTRVLKFVDFPFVCGADGTKILLPGTKFDPSYLFFALSSLGIPSRGYNRHYALLKQELLPCPPKSEQHAIAHALRTVQQAREATGRVIAAARELKRSLMRHLFTYGPVPVEQADRVELQETEVGPVPGKWEVVPLGQLVTRKITDGTHKTPEYTSTGVPFVTAKDIVGEHLYFSGCKFISPDEHRQLVARCKPEKGDVLLTKVGTLGNVAEVDVDFEFSIFVQVALVKPDFAKTSPHYLKYALLSPRVQSEIVRTSSQSTMKYIGVGKIAELPIPLPPLPEQKEIARILAAVDAKIAAEEARRTALDALFHTLLHHLMTAKVRVPGVAAKGG